MKCDISGFKRAKIMIHDVDGEENMAKRLTLVNEWIATKRCSSGYDYRILLYPSQITRIYIAHYEFQIMFCLDVIVSSCFQCNK